LGCSQHLRARLRTNDAAAWPPIRSSVGRHRLQYWVVGRSRDSDDHREPWLSGVPDARGHVTRSGGLLRSCLTQVGGGVLVAVSLAGSGCGSSVSSTASAGPHRVLLNVTSPATDLVTTASQVTIRGIVSPPEAHVTVQGISAPSSEGLFSTSVDVSKSENVLHVVATAPGDAPAYATVIVVRARPRVRAGHRAPGASGTQAVTPAAATVESTRLAAVAAPRRKPGNRPRTAKPKSPASPPPSRPAAPPPPPPSPPTGVTIPKAEGSEHAEPPRTAAEPAATIPQSGPSR
jgi:hypothetical protein